MPAAASDQTGWERNISMVKQMPMVVISIRIKASIFLMPRFCITRNNIVSKPDNHTVEEGHLEEKVQPDRRAENLRKVAGGDSDFAQHPERERDRTRVTLAARLGKIPARYDSHPGGE